MSLITKIFSRLAQLKKKSILNFAKESHLLSSFHQIGRSIEKVK